MCETVGNLTRMCEEHLGLKIAEHEGNYPEFARLYAGRDCCGGCLDSDVADVYGWPVASGAWADYESLRYLRGDDR